MDTDGLDQLNFTQMESLPSLTSWEFFAGGGMARLGLESTWRCVFANDISEKKAWAYRTRFGDGEMKVADVALLTPRDLPGSPGLVWASFPCQDLSLAGAGAGLEGARSGTFRPFWKLIRETIHLGRVPRIVVLENVVGTLTAHGGRDFATIVGAMAREGYRVGALVVDAVRFLPQSRPRLFIVAVSVDVAPSNLWAAGPSAHWHPRALRIAVERLPQRSLDSWIWWDLPLPTNSVRSLASLIEDEPTGVNWHTKEQTEHLISLMSPLHIEKLNKARQVRTRIVGTLYRRIRPNADGVKVQRAEIRFDQISGCLRTPAGGSSRQTLLVVEGNRVRSRLLSPREAARLMGVPDDYPLPERYNDAYHLFGDGLAVPVVNWLNRELLSQLAIASRVEIAA